MTAKWNRRKRNDPGICVERLGKHTTHLSQCRFPGQDREVVWGSGGMCHALITWTLYRSGHLHVPVAANPLLRKEHGTHCIGGWMSTISRILTIDQEMIRSRNTIDERAQDFVMNYELLLPVLKAYTQWTGSLHSTRNAWCFQYVSSIGTVCRSYQQQSTSPACSQQSPAPHLIPPPLSRDHHVVSGLLT